MFISRWPTPFCGLAPTSHPSDPKHIACPYNYTHNDCSADSGEVVTRHPATPLVEERNLLLDGNSWNSMLYLLPWIPFWLRGSTATSLLLLMLLLSMLLSLVIGCTFRHPGDNRTEQNRTATRNRNNNSNAIMSLHYTHESDSSDIGKYEETRPE